MTELVYYKKIEEISKKIFFSCTNVNMRDKLDISVALYKARIKAKLTAESAADKIGVAPRNIFYYECGGKRPNLDTLIKMCDIYNITIDELIKQSKKT